jgi:hypothetical protein
MSRLTDLEKMIRQSSQLLSEYEQIKQLSNDPREKARCDREIEQQRELRRGYLNEYLPLCAALHRAVPDDIREVAIPPGGTAPGLVPGEPAATPPVPPEPRSPEPVSFHLQLSRTPAGLEVRSSSQFTGQACTSISLPAPQALPRAARDDELRALGQALYDALIVGEVRAALDGVRNQALSQGTRVALQLRFDATAVAEAQRPWESLYDGRQFLLLAGVDLTRYITFPQAVVPVTVKPPLRVLLVAAAPKDQERLDVQVTKQVLEQMPNLLVDPLVPPTYHNLLERLVPYQEPVHVFDFEGHGGLVQGQGMLFFEDDEGWSDPVRADDLGIALRGQQVALAVINACHGADMDGVTLFNGVAPALILAGIPAVIGMQGPIHDRAARDFSAALYKGLSHCLPVTTAMAHARKFLYKSNEWYKPVLYLRSTDEAGRILDRS